MNWPNLWHGVGAVAAFGALFAWITQQPVSDELLAINLLGGFILLCVADIYDMIEDFSQKGGTE